MDASKASLPGHRFQGLAHLLESVLQFPVMSARTCLHLLRHMAACAYIVAHQTSHGPTADVAGIGLLTDWELLGQGSHCSRSHTYLPPVVDSSEGTYSIPAPHSYRQIHVRCIKPCLGNPSEGYQDPKACGP